MYGISELMDKMFTPYIITYVVILMVTRWSTTPKREKIRINLWILSVDLPFWRIVDALFIILYSIDPNVGDTHVSDVKF